MVIIAFLTAMEKVTCHVDNKMYNSEITVFENATVSDGEEVINSL